jgi:hypothetical protein
MVGSDLGQIGFLKLDGRVHGAHEGRDAIVGFRITHHGDGVALPRQGFQVDSGRDHPYQFVKDPDDIRAVGLQLLNHPHACQNLLAALFQCLDFLDLGVHCADFPVQQRVACLLGFDAKIDQVNPQGQHEQAQQCGDGQITEKRPLPLAAQFIAPGQ